MERRWGTGSRVSCNRRRHRVSCVLMGVAVLAIDLPAGFHTRIPPPILLIHGCGVRQGCGVREVKTFVPPLRPLVTTMLAICVSSRLFLGYRVYGRGREY